jgi:lambda family phage holin
MAEPLTFLQLVHLYRQQFGYGVVAGVLAALRHWHNGDSIKASLFETAVCMALAFGVDRLLTACSINTEDWGYLTSVGIGVFGWNTVKRVLAVKFPSLNGATGGKQNG